MDLEALHGDYVLVPANKAGNNVIIVCKNYYKEIHTKELTTNNSSASTYARSSVPIETLVSSHINLILESLKNLVSLTVCQSYIKIFISIDSLLLHLLVLQSHCLNFIHTAFNYLKVTIFCGY